MRTRITKKPWFGPKRYLGWGWGVASWEGRIAAALFIALLLVIGFAWPDHKVVAFVVVSVVFLVLVLLTGDPPGGPNAWPSGHQGSPDR